MLTENRPQAQSSLWAIFFVAEVSGLRSTKCIAKISQLAAEARDLRY